jgi:hypothetical protein
MLDGLIARGQEYQREFQAMVHGDASTTGLPGFREWYADVQGFGSLMRLSPEQQHTMDSWRISPDLVPTLLPLRPCGRNSTVARESKNPAVAGLS